MLQQRKSKRPKRTQSSLKRKSRKVSFQGQVGHRRRHQKRACRKISCFQAMTVRHKIWLICVSNIEAVLFFLWTTFQASLDASGLGWGTWLVSGYFCWTASCCRLYSSFSFHSMNRDATPLERWMHMAGCENRHQAIMHAVALLKASEVLWANWLEAN